MFQDLQNWSKKKWEMGNWNSQFFTGEVVRKFRTGLENKEGLGRFKGRGGPSRVPYIKFPP